MEGVEVMERGRCGGGEDVGMERVRGLEVHVGEFCGQDKRDRHED